MPFLSRRDRHARPLTRGETAMARLVFGDAIDYSKVSVYACGYLPFGLQPSRTAMAPNGNLYFPRGCFQDDFSVCDLAGRMWFIHEMTHVWQFQLGYPVRLRGAIRVGLPYAYTLAEDKRLSDYNMEAQGNLLADYFALRFCDGQNRLCEHRYRHMPGALALFETVLADFTRAPSERRNLPGRAR
ncbi:Rhs element Vgr protein [Caballeronia ptereochthonis]|uniref:Rhs element Vgr protein n=1 Tax=Caballeronia ptereochthonis TaxID=1777144 RepID=A0A158AQF8_9BURK|nr:Rhs element Vgr protein [Caballeronia ptereochthonis]SAK59900.1 Rhs element Vgr protein [Caballeronia ptereochthonis]